MEMLAAAIRMIPAVYSEASAQSLELYILRLSAE